MFRLSLRIKENEKKARNTQKYKWQVEDKNYQLYLIGNYLEQFRNTLFRKIMFAEFEKKTA